MYKYLRVRYFERRLSLRQIIVEAYNKNWIHDYESAKTILSDIMSNNLVEIYHIGSTSVEGLAAKPTIDILIIVNNIEHIDSLNEAMFKNGFMASGEGGIKGRRYFYKTLPTNQFIETHHVHVYQNGNPKYQEELLFRDYLRIDSTSRNEYEKLKLNLSLTYRDSPPEYTNAKAEFIQKTIAKARQYFRVEQ